MNSRKPLLIFFFVLFLLLGAIAGVVLLHFALTPPPNYFVPKIKVVQKGIRGSVRWKQNRIAYTRLIYDVYINPRYLVPEKKDFFVQLFSSYTGVDPQLLSKKLEANHRVKIAEVDERGRKDLLYLRRVLDKNRVFRSNRLGYRMGYEIVSPRIERIYPYQDLLEPILGFYNRSKKKGMEGLEAYYNYSLKPRKDGVISGYRDVIGNVIYDGSSQIHLPLNGEDLSLNINLILQKRLEQLLDRTKREYNVSEIVAGVIDSRTGKVIALATTNRYDPNHIRKEDIPNLSPSVIRRLYEPGSVMKPITFAILWESGLIRPGEKIYVNRGRWKPRWRKKPILDDEPFVYLTPRDIVVHSSNIGISKLVLRLDGETFYNWLVKFGFNAPTGIDLAYEKGGFLLPASKYEAPIYRTTTAYGYGLRVSFMELLRAYNAFNNGGYLLTPRIAPSPAPSPVQILSPTTSNYVLSVLRDVVLRGTGRKAYFPGLYIAGKTGTAHISAGKRGYLDWYNSSFFGFANDQKGERYTIGVTFFRVGSGKYFASQTAVPLFRKIVEIMVEEGYLTPSMGKFQPVFHR
ncbi:MAG: penicillin-binding protein 2 [Epsilonproteobacteria bacterium]|nr:penicillin-binding protein 2 [Campylobacterota bacterium]NPA89175.1 penicillin-binding protein 2 [Campylobacterota bacterium]